MLKDIFDRVVIISLKRRPDRRRRLEKLVKQNWPFKDPIFFDALDGGSGLIPTPHTFVSGGGAYGCKLSWCRVLEDAMTDNINSLLVLEDDAVWRPTFEEDSTLFFEHLPEDWQVVFLGGQNMSSPQKVSPGVGRTKNTQRTHAIGFRSGGIRFAYGVMAASDRHIDHRFGPAAGRHGRCYQPLNFLIGQDSTQSDISGRKDHSRFWSSPDKQYPICFLNATQEVAEKLTEYGFHYGFDLDEDGLDRGLGAIFDSEGRYQGGISKFLSTVSWEAASFTEGQGITTIWHPKAKMSDKLKKELPERTLVTPNFENVEKALEFFKDHYPDLKPRSDRARPPVVLLQCPDEIIKLLVDNGHIHIGRWRDKVTGLDKGLIEFFKCGGTDLSAWYSVLEKEARETNVSVGIHHPKATKELAETCGRRVVVVNGVSYKECLKQMGVQEDVD